MRIVFFSLVCHFLPLEFWLDVMISVQYAKLPLQPEEFFPVFRVRVGFTNPNLENIPGLKTLLSSCIGLATVAMSRARSSG